MGEFNFRKDRIEWAKIPRDQHAAASFEVHVLFAQQLLYDLAQSQHGPGDQVQRHEKLDRDWDRFQTGIRVALVYLVARLDAELDRAFEQLWRQRPTFLHDRLKEYPEFREGLRVALKDIWSPVVSERTIRDFFQDRILQRLSIGGPKKKVDAFVRLFAKDPPDSDVVYCLADAINERNEFVHPHDSQTDIQGSPRCGVPSWQANQQTNRTVVAVDELWFEAVCDAFLRFVNWLSNHVVLACSDWVASNSWQFEKLLTESQRVRFEFLLPNSGAYCKDLPKLLDTIRERVKRGDAFLPPPKILLLELGMQVQGAPEQVGSFCRDCTDVPVVFCELYGCDGLPLAEELAKELNYVEIIRRDRTGRDGHTCRDASYDPIHELQQAVKRRTGVG